jgi:hypothetical protein
MDRHRRLSRMTALAALSVALAVFAVAPPLASGQTVVDDLLKGLGLGAQDATQGTALPGRKGYKPPAHGSNPDAQGTTSTPDYSPSSALPVSGETTSGADGEYEDVVLGSRGEQITDGTDRITDGTGDVEVNILSLFGFEVVPPVEAGPGESESGLLEPIQQSVHDAICAGSGDQLCLAVLQDDSKTTNPDSTNSFRGAKVYLGGREGGVHSSLLESNGNIQPDSSCQTSAGDYGPVLLKFGGSVDTVSEGSTDSQACNGAKTPSGDARWLAVFGTDAPSPCESWTQDVGFTAFSPLLSLVCNDSSGGIGEAKTATGHSFGMREALMIFLFEVILVMAGLAATRLAVGHRGATS